MVTIILLMYVHGIRINQIFVTNSEWDFIPIIRVVATVTEVHYVDAIEQLQTVESSWHVYWWRHPLKMHVC